MDHHPLRKRDNFRQAFDGFAPEVIARYGKRKVTALMNDAGIVRNRAKIEGTIASARSYLDIVWRRAPGFSTLLWSFVDGAPQVNHRRSIGEVPAGNAALARSPRSCPGAASRSSSAPTIVYAFMQAVGIVNDHLVTCHRHPDNAVRRRGKL